MAIVNVKIEGLSPLLMHRYPMTEIPGLEKKTPEEQAEHSAYRIPGDSGELYIPGVCIQRALVGAASYSKGKGRATLQKPAAACLLISPEYAGLGTKDFSIDSRPVVIAATKGRVMRHRPRIDKWSCEFILEYDDTLLSAKQVREIVDNAGSRVGLLDFRPARNGPFGRFTVTHWEAEE
jgi:hypothetical protein